MTAVDASAQPGLLYDGSDGATCEYFNRGAQIRWRHRLGDWKDARGTEQGDIPFARASVGANDSGRSISWDVTTLVQGWLAGRYVNAGLLATTAKGQQGTATFHSREAASGRIPSEPRLDPHGRHDAATFADRRYDSRLLDRLLDWVARNDFRRRGSAAVVAVRSDEGRWRTRFQGDARDDYDRQTSRRCDGRPVPGCARPCRVNRVDEKPTARAGSKVSARPEHCA